MKKRKEEYPIGYQFKRISEWCRHFFDRQLESMDLTFSQFELIHFLAKNQGEKITKKDIGSALELKHSTIIGILKRLEKKDMVCCEVDGKDGRYRNVSLTKKAINSLEEMERQRDFMDDKILSLLETEEEAELRRLLKKILNGLPQA